MAQISEKHMREYETIYVLKPEIEDEASVNFIKKMMGLIEREGGKHLQVTNWGRKKLAWERDRHQKGMYVHHRYLGGPNLVKEYERNLGLDENVILRQTVKLRSGVDASTATVEADVLNPPATKEQRREERRDDRDDDDRDYDRD